MWVGTNEPAAIEFKENGDTYFAETKVSAYSINEQNVLTFKIAETQGSARIEAEHLVLDLPGPKPVSFRLKKVDDREAYLKAIEALRWESQQKAIANNLRQILYFGKDSLTESGSSKVGYNDLLKEGNTVISRLRPIAGEDYSSLVITPETESLTVTVKNGKTVTYPLPKE